MTKDYSDEILSELDGDTPDRTVDVIEFDSDGNPILDGVQKQEVLDIVDIEDDEPVIDTPAVGAVEEENTSEEEPVEDVEAPKKQSRSQERIRELAKKASEEAAKRRQAEDRLRKTEAVYAETMVKTLEKDIEQYKKTLAQAISEGDTENQIALTEALQDAKSQLTQFKQIASTAPTANESNIPSAALEWAQGKEILTSNSEYAKLTADQRRVILPIRKAIPQIAKEMIEVDNFNAEDPFFYEELDMRLVDKFPVYADIALLGIDALQLDKSEDKKSPDPSPSSASKQLSVLEKAKKTPVKGPVPASAPPKPSGVKSVKLAPDQLSYFKNYLEPAGVTLAEYAKEVERELKTQAK